MKKKRVFSFILSENNSSENQAKILIYYKKKKISMRMRVCGLGSSTVCVLVAPGSPHASPCPRLAGGVCPLLDRWVGGGECHYHDGGGERGGGGRF